MKWKCSKTMHLQMTLSKASSYAMPTWVPVMPNLSIKQNNLQVICALEFSHDFCSCIASGDAIGLTGIGEIDDTCLHCQLVWHDS